MNVKELIGVYPLLNGTALMEKKKCRKRKTKELNHLDETWVQINQAAEIINAKLKASKNLGRMDYRAEEGFKARLKDIYESEKSDICNRIGSELEISINEDYLNRISELLQSSECSPVLRMRKIRYGKLEESWSLGWDSDNGTDINTYNEFAYTLDLAWRESHLRVAVQGEIKAIHEEPKLRVDHLDFCLLGDKPKNKELTDYLKGEPKGLEIIKDRYYYTPKIIALQTQVLADSFLKGSSMNLSGAKLDNPHKPTYAGDETIPINKQYRPLLSPIAKIIHFMDSQAEKIPYLITRDSFVIYDLKGRPSLTHKEARA